MRQDVIARQVRAMKDAGLDAIVSISPENFAYVTGFLSPTQPLMRWRHAMALVTADGAVALVVVDMEASTIRAKSPPGTEIAVWREFKFDAMEVLAELLRKHGLANARIGIEMDYLPAGDFAALRELLAAGELRAGAGHAGAAARDQDAGGDRHPAPAVAHRRQGDHRGLSLGARGLERDGPRRGAHPRHLRAGRRILQADDRGDRRAQRLSQCRPDRPRAQARRRLPRRDFSDDRRLSRRRLPHRRGRRAAAARRAHLGEPDRVQVSAARRDQARRVEPRDLRALSRARSASSGCRRSPSSATASACICTRIPISARPTTARSRPAWCSASSR